METGRVAVVAGRWALGSGRWLFEILMKVSRVLHLICVNRRDLREIKELEKFSISIFCLTDRSDEDLIKN